MNRIKIVTGFLAALILMVAIPAFAEVLNTSVKAGINTRVRTNSETEATSNIEGSTTIETRSEVKAQAQTQQDNRIKNRANQEIDRRIDGLTKLIVRINDAKRISTPEKTTIIGTLQNQASSLTSLKTKITAETDISVIKTDTKSITQSYKIFALVMPQGALIAATDRITTTAELMTALSAKFQVRISALRTAGKDTTTLDKVIADYNAKISDAKIQAQAAMSASNSLTLDNNDQVHFQSNKQILVDARAKLKGAQDDLKTARQYAAKILGELKSIDINSSTSASTTTTTR